LVRDFDFWSSSAQIFDLFTSFFGEHGSNGLDETMHHLLSSICKSISNPPTGVFIFRGALNVGNQTGDYINEYLAVKDGKLREIRAVMINSKKDIKSVWPEDSTRPYASL
jgi:hypothetical protein